MVSVTVDREWSAAPSAGPGTRLVAWLRPAPSFLAVGAASSALYGGLYLVLREVATSQWANGVALVLSTLVSTAGNRRLTFHSTAASTVVPHHALGLGLVVAGFGLTSGGLGLLAALDPSATRTAELVVLAVANALVGVLRFTSFSLVMRRDVESGVPAPSLS
ncbi:GtrA family protein [uncultured Nocardioides sp.]|uniref:GtrA family protein n=1 Tax=uncultured Nocardioides sp. TaxID=198441 RepID=UPI002636F791|nr:GtrA family protein [uncultured Nocardioides sp.]